MVKINLATAEDAREMLNIYQWYILNTTFSFELAVPSLEAYTDRMLKYSSEAPWLVAKAQEKVIGFAYASPHRGRAAYQWNREVSIYLKEDFQGSGIAQKLYSTLFELLKIQGYANALAGIVYPNAKSVRFHQKIGFQLVGRYKNIGFKFGKWQQVEWYEFFLQEKKFIPSKILTMEELKASSKFLDLIKPE